MVATIIRLSDINTYILGTKNGNLIVFKDYTVINKISLSDYGDMSDMISIDADYIFDGDRYHFVICNYNADIFMISYSTIDDNFLVKKIKAQDPYNRCIYLHDRWILIGSDVLILDTDGHVIHELYKTSDEERYFKVGEAVGDDILISKHHGIMAIYKDGVKILNNVMIMADVFKVYGNYLVGSDHGATNLLSLPSSWNIYHHPNWSMSNREMPKLIYKLPFKMTSEYLFPYPSLRQSGHYLICQKDDSTAYIIDCKNMRYMSFYLMTHLKEDNVLDAFVIQDLDDTLDIDIFINSMINDTTSYYRISVIKKWNYIPSFSSYDHQSRNALMLSESSKWLIY